jgi:hypothetical protein
MKIGTFARVMRDRYRGGLKEKYWEWCEVLGRVARMFRPRNWTFARVVAGGHLRYLLRAVRPVKGETTERMRAAVDWLLRGQKASPDDGVSFGYFPCDSGTRTGWRVSYPETTGYIIQTLVEYADRYDRPEIRERALEMAVWEAEIQMPSGAVQGGPVCEPEKQVEAVFNTGMVLQGLTALPLDADERVARAARRAADFLVNDIGEDGHFRSHGKFVKQDKTKTYNCLCAWALYRYGDLVDDDTYRRAAVRVAEAAAGEQIESGWFKENCLTRPSAPLTHTIGYTLQGVLEVALLAGREDLVACVQRGMEPVLRCMSKRGFLHGRFFSDWEPASFSSCLTGNAQLAIVCYRLAEHTGDAKYRDAADRLMNFLKAVQVVGSRDEGVNGAIAGSFPIMGGYMTCGYPNWATKYFVDGLMHQDRHANPAARAEADRQEPTPVS